MPSGGEEAQHYVRVLEWSPVRVVIEGFEGWGTL